MTTEELAREMSRMFFMNMESRILRLFTHNVSGKVYVSGLFRLHDELGFHLTDSLRECKRLGLIPCLTQFKADAIRAGWTPEKADRVIAEAKADSAQ